MKKKFKADKICRLNRVPVFCNENREAMGHAGSDIEFGYKTIQKIKGVRGEMTHWFIPPVF
ncbi:hypothetical protein Ct9H90mP29_19170 [bacterium]|nr:MAG: hypothetical protein Ct9H90mP29_19170 [bacterium]